MQNDASWGFKGLKTSASAGRETIIAGFFFIKLDLALVPHLKYTLTITLRLALITSLSISPELYAAQEG